MTLLDITDIRQRTATDQLLNELAGAAELANRAYANGCVRMVAQLIREVLPTAGWLVFRTSEEDDTELHLMMIIDQGGYGHRSSSPAAQNPLWSEAGIIPEDETTLTDLLARQRAHPKMSPALYSALQRTLESAMAAAGRDHFPTDPDLSVGCDIYVLDLAAHAADDASRSRMTPWPNTEMRPITGFPPAVVDRIEAGLAQRAAVQPPAGTATA